jgi:hypothetical protein
MERFLCNKYFCCYKNAIEINLMTFSFIILLFLGIFCINNVPLIVRFNPGVKIIKLIDLNFVFLLL